MVFALDKSIWFPPINLADEDGLLAVGGDLSTERLLLAYQNGIFPWYDEEPICWYAPKNRFVIFPEQIKVSKSMKSEIKSNNYHIKKNSSFNEVIKNCASISRNNQLGTWINHDMMNAYNLLHKLGKAHSVEVFEQDKLVGGLYGVSVNNVFCGESMFSNKRNTSKLALIWLCKNENYQLIDCQFHTPHLESMGGTFISLNEYLSILKK